VPEEAGGSVPPCGIASDESWDCSVASCRRSFRVNRCLLASWLRSAASIDGSAAELGATELGIDALGVTGFGTTGGALDVAVCVVAPIAQDVTPQKSATAPGAIVAVAVQRGRRGLSVIAATVVTAFAMVIALLAAAGGSSR
jgi:hypothetical protein